MKIIPQAHNLSKQQGADVQYGGDPAANDSCILYGDRGHAPDGKTAAGRIAAVRTCVDDFAVEPCVDLD